MMNLEAALDGGDVGPQLIGLARGQRVFARHTAVCQTVVARWLGCRQLRSLVCERTAGVDPNRAFDQA